MTCPDCDTDMARTAQHIGKSGRVLSSSYVCPSCTRHEEERHREPEGPGFWASFLDAMRTDNHWFND